MAITGRRGAIFAAGLALGAAVSAWMVLGLRSTQVADKPQVSATAKPQAGVPDAPRTSTPAPAPVAVAARHKTECPVQPLLAASGERDGQFRLQDVSTKTAADVASFITVGKEAAAAGKRRDAEIAFVMACRVADRVGAADSAGPADARYRLGRHYASVALSGDPAVRAGRAELLRRAELLYADSLEAYVARHGQGHEKSRFAAEGLAAVRQTLAQAGQQQPAAAPRKPARAAARPPQPRQADVAVTEPPLRQATGSSTQSRRARNAADDLD